MIGFILALLVAGWKLAISSVSSHQAYLSSTNFLFWWYAVWGSLILVIAGIISLIAGVAGVVLGTESGARSKIFRGAIGGLIGIALGGAISLPVVGWFAFRRIILIMGALLLHSALVLEMGGYVWDPPRLVIGIILMIIGLKMKGTGIKISSKSPSRIETLAIGNR